MCLPTSLVQKITPLTFTPSIASMSSFLRLKRSPGRRIPALFTSMSTLPNLLTASSTIPVTSFSSATFAFSATASPPEDSISLTTPAASAAPAV